MKKLTLLSFAFIAILVASCKKDHTCTCSFTTNEPGAATEEITVVFKKTTKKSAKMTCVSSNVLPDGEQYSEITTCTLK